MQYLLYNVCCCDWKAGLVQYFVSNRCNAIIFSKYSLVRIGYRLTNMRRMRTLVDTFITREATSARYVTSSDKMLINVHEYAIGTDSSITLLWGFDHKHVAGTALHKTFLWRVPLDITCFRRCEFLWALNREMCDFIEELCDDVPFRSCALDCWPWSYTNHNTDKSVFIQPKAKPLVNGTLVPIALRTDCGSTSRYAAACFPNASTAPVCQPSSSEPAHTKREIR